MQRDSHKFRIPHIFSWRAAGIRLCVTFCLRRFHSSRDYDVMAGGLWVMCGWLIIRGSLAFLSQCFGSAHRDLEWADQPACKCRF